MMAQVFSPDEFKRALSSDSEFAREVLENVLPIYDPNKILMEIKVKYGG